ncbi:50S ribosomal protein L4 [Mesoterricola silvestris]|uniref:Large ribosomal subunit protein uL4 n=1 Tax=Mesoterricola silvestris TaxID=2927979 RepID=A0AA48H383_9BACT|nr:50S ribosomal protein L4 [Mesoterricola silvestris]BDU71103.1 50S ribosomal protein L4 [Mesoterricola silvestris]
MAVFSHPVLNLDNKQVDTVELMAEVFKLEEINNHLIWESVRHHLARRRAGTAKTKDKSEVSGSGRKLWKQKGTGRARVGSIRSIIWKGGGTAHGPNPRSFDYAFPKRARRSALRNALSAKFASGQVVVVENWTVDSHKTKALIATLAKLGVAGSALLVGTSDKATLAAGNNPKLHTIESLGVNVYDLLKFDQVVFSKEAILALQEVVKP